MAMGDGGSSGGGGRALSVYMFIGIWWCWVTSINVGYIVLLVLFVDRSC